LYEGDLDDGDEPKVAPVSPEVNVHANSLLVYVTGGWLKFAPRMMNTWVDEEIIKEYGRYVQPLMNDDYPLTDFDNEENLISLLEGQGYTCIFDDLVGKAIWGD
jgi:hypothetical protein